MRRALFALPFAVAALAGGACGGSPADPGADPGSPSSIVLIVIDALRADHLGTYGYTARPTSPNIDLWAGRGLVFERAWATSPWTLPSFGSILTGYLPSAHAAGFARLPIIRAALSSCRSLSPVKPFPSGGRSATETFIDGLKNIILLHTAAKS